MMTKYIYILTLIASLIVSMSACTTTSKSVSTGYSVEPITQLEKAKMAFNAKNYPLAAKMLEPLAKEGQDYAQYALGYMYYNGMGVPLNRSIAKELLSAAASSGNKNAIEALRLLSSPASNNSSVIEKTPSPQPSNAEPVNVSEAEETLEDDKQPEKSQLIMEPESLKEVDTLNEPTDVASMLKKPKPPENNSTGDSEKVTKNLDSLTESEKWIISQPDTNFTIQLLVSGSETAMQRYIIDKKLQDGAVYYKSSNNSADVYILIQGSFESFSQASKAISLLPTDMKKAKPWVRSIGVIRKLLLAR